MSTGQTLTECEAAFNAAPSLATGKAWMDRAQTAFSVMDINLRERHNIELAVRCWCLVNQIPRDQIP